MTKARDIASAAPAPSTVSATELGYLDGVTSAIQTQLNQKPEFAAGKNKIINGDFGINQRSFTSTTGADTYTYDRWMTQNGGSNVGTFSAQTFTVGSAPVSGYESSNYLQIVTASQTDDAITGITQRIEDVRTLSGQTVTVSFWAKAASGTPSIAVELVQNFGSGGSSSVTGIGAVKIPITTSWARYSTTISIPALSGVTIGAGNRLGLIFWVSAGSAYNARTNTLGPQNGTFQFWGVQVEAGSVATAFQTATGTIAGELAACQRYYYRQSIQATPSRFSLGYATSTTAGSIFTYLPVQMRTAPTALEQNGTAGDYSIVRLGTTVVTCSAVPTVGSNSVNVVQYSFTVASGLTAGEGIEARPVNTNAYLGWSAEL
jgi:hypothetical protein